MLEKYKTVYHNYLHNKLKPEKWRRVGIFLLVVSFSGIFGWIYEFIFYYFNGGMQNFFLQGGNFLPWINIYAIGAVLVAIAVRKVKHHPALIFLISAVVTGVLEYIAGWLVYTIGNGTRYWDYNTEILNFCNIDGFICLRSVLFFGLSSMFLIYFLIPFGIYLSQKINKKIFLFITIALFSLIFIDEFYNLVICKIFGAPDAMQIYKSMGYKYVEQIKL